MRPHAPLSLFLALSESVRLSMYALVGCSPPTSTTFNTMAVLSVVLAFSRRSYMFATILFLITVLFVYLFVCLFVCL